MEVPYACHRESSRGGFFIVWDHWDVRIIGLFTPQKAGHSSDVYEGGRIPAVGEMREGWGFKTLDLWPEIENQPGSYSSTQRSRLISTEVTSLSDTPTLSPTHTAVFNQSSF